MSTLPAHPVPADAPAPGACVRIERPEKGLAVLVLDPPHRTKAVLDLWLMRDLASALDKLAQDGGLAGVVITGREPTSFALGADLDALAVIQDAAVASELSRFGQEVFGRIARLRARSVAAVGGPVPGGAYELALACDAIVACDDASTRLGLPETQLGILPGWGGSQRLPRRVGVPTALQAILSGKLYPARQAQKLGLVDRLTKPDYLRRVAADVALRREKLPRRRRGIWSWLVDRNPLTLAQIEKRAGTDVAEKTGGHYPAPPRALRLVVDACRTPLDQGLSKEALALGELAVTPVCKNLVALFRAAEEQKKLARLADGSEARELRRVGVIGAGVMGGAIAGLLAERGVEARLADLERKALDAAVSAHRERVARALSRRGMQPHEGRSAIDRLESVAGVVGFARCDLVLEAVAEKLGVKRQVLSLAAAQAGTRAILATNTSSLSVDAIAAGLPAPERVVGMHFFNPVHKMPLVELVRGKATSEEAVAATARLALALGKTPVVVKDVAGFLVNRLLGPYLDEAVRFLSEGVEPERVDAAARAFGMPMGPLELLDEVGLDIAAHAARSLEEAYGERMRTSPVVGRMLAAGQAGRKAGRGFYLWRADRKDSGLKKQDVNPRLAEFLDLRGRRPAEISDGSLLDQLVLAMINEAYLCLAERVVEEARTIDLATVYGLGFPPFRGGLMRYAAARGPRDRVATLRRIQAAPDLLARSDARARFEPAPLLLAAVEKESSLAAPAGPSGA